MGISRDSRHKRRLTGGRRNIHCKKHKYEMGRPSAMTKLGHKAIHMVRGRGNNPKFRAIRLETGNFSWGSETTTRRTKIVDVVYNASNNELVRTKTLVKNCIVQVDATPFRQYYEERYGGFLGKATKKDKVEEKKHSKHVLKNMAKRKAATGELPAALTEQFLTGRLYACISSRPGQSGRCDGYILEGEELGFYVKKLKTK
eukprot:gb/GEZN01016068.1/.p2 GENE.gb/GEZN01016068.1/~~gb/GEZN01016068.1/.p2  ORF type:complete len:201 (+),score=43.45 gb/GEZN01016068.1/:141-743(+)